jgi:tetratricopeptide (TPR) repeat protein
MQWRWSPWLECLAECLVLAAKALWTAVSWLFRNTKDVIAFLSLVIGLVVLGYLFSLASEGVVESINVPEELTKQGYSGAVVAHRLVDQFKTIRNGAGGEGREPLAMDASPKDSLKLLEAEVPITFVVEMIRSVFALPSRKIGGDIIVLHPGAAGSPPVYRVLLRIESEFCAPGTCVLDGSGTDLESVLEQLSFAALRKVDPYVLAVYYLRKNDIPAAEKLIPDFLRQKDISKADRFNVKGGILRRLGQIGGALDAYGAAEKEDPANPSPYFNRAELMRYQGEFDKAILEYRNAIDRQNSLHRDDPIQADFYCGLGNGYRDQAQSLSDSGKAQEANRLSSKAAEAYGRGDSMNPANARCSSGWGVLLLNEQKIGDAKGKFEQAIRLDPNLPQAYWGLAECLRRNNQTKDAIELYRKAIQISEEHYHSDKKAEEAARKQLDALGATP